MELLYESAMRDEIEKMKGTIYDIIWKTQKIANAPDVLFFFWLLSKPLFSHLTACIENSYVCV